MLLYGCTGISSRIKEYQTEFDTYSPEIQHLLKKGRIRTGFTRTQVYIALGEPFDRQHFRWAYTTCAWKKVVSLKSSLEYESEYERAWKSYSKRKEKNKDAVFIPPARLIEESECRRYISRFVYFENDRVSRIERPMKVIWVGPKW
jgi:hypothetical protein